MTTWIHNDDLRWLWWRNLSRPVVARLGKIRRFPSTLVMINSTVRALHLIHVCRKVIKWFVFGFHSALTSLFPCRQLSYSNNIENALSLHLEGKQSKKINIIPLFSVRMRTLSFDKKEVPSCGKPSITKYAFFLMFENIYQHVRDNGWWLTYGKLSLIHNSVHLLSKNVVFIISCSFCLSGHLY